MPNQTGISQSKPKSKFARLPSRHSPGKRRTNTDLAATSEPFPICGGLSGVRPQLVLIDDALIIHLPGLSVAGDQPQYLRQLRRGPLVEWNYCDNCKVFCGET